MKNNTFKKVIVSDFILRLTKNSDERLVLAYMNEQISFDSPLRDIANDLRIHPSKLSKILSQLEEEDFLYYEKYKIRHCTLSMAKIYLGSRYIVSFINYANNGFSNIDEINNFIQKINEVYEVDERELLDDFYLKSIENLQNIQSKDLK